MRARLSAMTAADSDSPALIVANPVSGSGRGGTVGRELANALARAGRPVELLLTGGPGEARAKAASVAGSVGLVVSVGGDGPLREVLARLAEHDAALDRIPIGVVPMGTGNVLGTDLRLPRDVASALHVIEAGRTTRIDLASVNGDLSFLVTGVGPDAQVVKDVDAHRHAGRMSKWHYLPAALRTYTSYPLEPLWVEVDGEALSYPCVEVLCSNLVHYGGVVPLPAGRLLDDGLFEVFLFRHCGRLRLLAYVLRFLLGRMPGGPVEVRRARRVRVSSARPVPYHVDGDPLGDTPVELEVTGRRFLLLVP